MIRKNIESYRHEYRRTCRYRFKYDLDTKRLFVFSGESCQKLGTVCPEFFLEVLKGFTEAIRDIGVFFGQI